MGRYFCKEISSFWLDNRDVQGRNEVRWRLGKETSLAPPCSNQRPFRSKCTVLKKSAYVIVGTFWLSAVIRRSGNCAPLPPSLRLWCYAIKIGKFSENKHIFKSEHHELLFHEHLQFSNTIRHGSCTDCQQRLLAAFQVFSCSFCVTSMPAPRVFSAWTCVCFSNNKTFPTFNKLLFQG